MVKGGCMAKATGLKKYYSKRDLKKSGEPADVKTTSKRKKNPIFVIQKHNASHEHYDLRLEISGALKSWAVPKGPSLNPKVKRLAIETEDHPMAYANFEGNIPPGNYGAGSVMIWDYGTYTNIKREKGRILPIDKCYQQGRIEVELKGKKVQGAFALIKTHYTSENSWLLIKMNDEYASARKNPVNTKKRSAVSNRTMTQIAKDKEHDQN